MLASTDGLQWTTAASGVSDNLKEVSYGNGQFLAVGDHGRVLRSTDGATWLAGSAGTTQPLNGVTCGGGLFVAVGSGGTIVSSPDGITWTSAHSGLSGWLRGLAYYANTAPLVWAAAGEAGTILQSTDAITWTASQTTTSVTKQIVSVGEIEALFSQPTSAYFTGARQNGLLLQGGYALSLAHIPVPKEWAWTPVSTPGAVPARLFGIAELDDTSFAVGDTGTIVASPGGFSGSFARLLAGTSASLHAAIAFADRVVAVGDNHTVVVSDPLPDSPLLNLSALSPTSSSSPLTVGFVISGSAPKRILIRAAGPALAAFNVAAPLPTPS